MELHEFSVIMMRWFYKVVIGYLLLTRVVLVPLRIIVAYDDKYEWVSYLVEETFSFVFCGVMFYVFRLLHNNAISDEKEEECEIDIKQQE